MLMEIKYFTKDCTQILEHVFVIEQVSSKFFSMNFLYSSTDYFSTDRVLLNLLLQGKQLNW